ncbi:MAG: hypothetical protein J5919_02685, partial [Clostridia bacterium]|nr:hypothetical protein [Clostridia bacterium]
MKTKRILICAVVFLLSLCMIWPAAAEGETPAFPQATVTEVETPEASAPIYDTSFQLTGETVAIDAEFIFAAVTPTAEQVEYYGSWVCDYRVTFSDNLAAESFGLYGAYGDYKAAFKYPVDTGTDPIYLLASVGLDSHLTFNDILGGVNPFNCGVFNLSNANAGKTMTVELVIWAPDDVPANATVVATKSYTFPTIPLPTATVTEVVTPEAAAPLYNTSFEATGETIGIDAEYVFAAVEPTAKQIAVYGNWICDYRVTFSDNLAAESFGLYGAYGEDYDLAF